jgi:hypothetical protein
MKWQGYLRWQIPSKGTWKDMEQKTFAQFGTFGEITEEIDAFMKSKNIYPDSIVIYKIWLVNRKQGANVLKCSN